MQTVILQLTAIVRADASYNTIEVCQYSIASLQHFMHAEGNV